MEAGRRTAAERRRELQETARAKTRLGVRLGVLGVVVLFLGGFGAAFATDYILLFLVAMGAGIVALLAAFFLVRGSVLSLSTGDETKIL